MMRKRANPQPTTQGVQHAVVALDALHAHPQNYRHHPDQQISRLAASLARFSQVRSIVVQEGADGRYLIVAGHGLVEAARREGFTELHADVIPATWSPTAVAGYLVADNESSRGADDDLTQLAAMLEEQRAAGEHLEALGYSDDELAALLDDLAQAALTAGQREVDDPDGGGDDFDTTPDENGPTRVQPGDLWQLGVHRLLCGDSTRAEDVARLMAGERAEMMWTDPPYGVSYVGKTKKALTIQNDGAGDLERLLHEAFSAADDKALDEGAAIYIAHPAGALSVTFGVCFVEQGWRFHERLIWVKDSMVLGHSDYHLKHEDIIFGYKAGAGRRGRGGEGWYGDNAQVSVFEVPRPKRSEEHPTMKPVALVAAMMANSSDTGHVVYEPFCGSGSTLIAADRLGRKCRAIEIDPKFADVILRRREAETGREATLLERAERPPERPTEEAAHATPDEVHACVRR